MHEDLQKAVDFGKLSPEAAATIDQLQPGAFCRHKSWGFGRVAAWDLLTGQIVIDFKGKKGHPMQLQYAAATLEAVPSDHILAQIYSDPAAVRTRASSDPVALVRHILASHGGRLTIEQMTQTLVPDAMDAAAFKKWWEIAKKKCRADAHIHLPARKQEPIELHHAPVNQSAKLFAKFRDARHPKDQVLALEAILKALDDLAQEVEEMRSLAVQVEDSARKGQRLHASQAVELLIARDEICSRHHALQPGKGAPSVADILLGEESRLPELFNVLPSAKHRRVLAHFKAAFGAEWTDRALRLASRSSARLVQEAARIFEAEGVLLEMHDAVERWIRERSASAEVLLWLCKERGGPFPDLFTADLVGAILSALERDVLDEIKRGTKLHDLLIDDKALLGDLLAGADIDQVRDVMRKLLFTPFFEDVNKRSLLARIIKLHPEVQGMISGDTDRTMDDSMIVSWASLERRRAEYEDLVNRLIPQNRRDISIARSYGDLRENFEYKAAKDQQRVLMRRKSEMERELSRARGTNFEDADESRVSIGSVVHVTDEQSGASESYSILGAWDSLPERSVVSYKAGIGKALLGKQPGEIAELPAETGVRTVRIERIEPFKSLELLTNSGHSPPDSRITSSPL